MQSKSAVFAAALLVHQAEIELVDCIRSIGDQFAEKDLLMRVDRVDHQVEHTLGFGLKLFLFHHVSPFCRKISTLFV